MRIRLYVSIFFILMCVLAYSAYSVPQALKTTVPATDLARANELYLTGDVEAAIALYQQLLAQYHLDREHIMSFAHLVLQLGRPSDAIRLLQEHIDDHDIESLVLSGMAFLANEQPAQAVMLLSQAKAIADRWDIDWLLALAYSAQANYEAAVLHYVTALNIGTKSPLVLNDYAYTLARMGTIDKAIETMQQSLRLDSSQYYLYWQLADWAASIEDYTAAIEFWKSAERIRSVPDIQQKLKQAQQLIPDLEPTADPVMPAAPKLISHRTVTPSADPTRIRIGLMERVKTVTLSAGADFELIQEDTVLATGIGKTLWEVSAHPEKPTSLVFTNPSHPDIVVPLPIRLHLLDPTTTVALYDLAYGQGYFWAGRETRQYRGDLEFLLFPAGLTIVNEVSMEEYLYAVVPGEMIASWPMEALKAQAVAARSYTVFHLGRFASRGFDLVASVVSAHYPGVTREHPRTTEAVIATRNQVITYNNRPIDAVYSANNGGLRASSAEVWGGHRDYLLAGADGGDSPLHSPAQFQRWIRDHSDSYSNIGIQQSNYRWSRTYSHQDLQRIAPARIGQVQDVRILSRGESGRVTAITWIGTDGSHTVTGDSIRSSLGGLRSNLFIMQPLYHEGRLASLRLQGAGWGHGVGMSQAGAYGMATRGYSYLDILAFYYPNTQIKSID